MNKYFYLSFFLSRVLFLGGCFSLLFNVSTSSILISSVLGTLLGYVLLYLFYKRDGISNKMKILISIIILFINILSNTVLTSTYLLTSTPIIFIILLFIFICIYGNNNYFKISNILFYISFILIFIASLSISNRISISNYIDMFNGNIIKGIIIFSCSILLPNLLIIDNDKLKYKYICRGFITGALVNIIVIFFVLGIFGPVLSVKLRFIEYLVLKRVNILGFINNIENILILEWLYTIMISGMISINILFKYVNKRYVIYIISLLVISIYIVLNSNYNILLYIKNYIFYLLWFLIILSLVIKNDINN